MSKTCLLILNPRTLPECLLSLELLKCPKVWLENWTERELEQVIPEVIDSPQLKDFTHFSIISDDCFVSQNAYDAVTFFAETDDDEVYSGYVNCDVTSEYCSITKTPFPSNKAPVRESYDFVLLQKVRECKNPLILTYFTGMTFTTMSRKLWKKYPFQCFGYSGKHGWASDYSLALRLRDGGTPIWAVKEGFIYHTKLDWTVPGVEGRRALNLGRLPARVRYDLEY